MALEVTEFPASELSVRGAFGPAHNMGIHSTTGLVTQSVAIGGTSTQSAAFDATTRIIRLIPDVACHVAFGADPTATTADRKLQPLSETYHLVTPGEEVAVIETS